ncbi:MAG TPA: hypothetical protein VKS81_04965 [Bacteroidota bacterium]|nr:hypothetical protein [Bacteroidota bacterium]
MSNLISSLKFINALFFVLLLAFLFSSCHTNGPTSPDDYAVGIVPLKSGNKWTYETTVYDSMGIAGGTFNSGAMIDSIRVIDGQNWFAANWGKVSFFQNRPDGLWMISESLPNGLPQSYIKYPATVGEQFQTAGALMTTVIASNVPVTTRAGTFYCYQYRTNGSIYSLETESNIEYEDTFFSPGTGLVALRAYTTTLHGTLFMSIEALLTGDRLN